MKIFAYEHITGGGLLDQALPPQLAREGGLMLEALLRDLSDIPDIPDENIITSRDPRLPAFDFSVQTLIPRNPDEASRMFNEGVERADAVWLIAPETQGLLERLSRKVLAQKRILLGSRPDAVWLCGSKLATSRHLARAGIAAVPTYTAQEKTADSAQGWVVKPDDGAGCRDTRLYSALAPARAQAAAQRHVLQPYIPGKHLSLSLLCRNGEAFVLSCNEQRIVIEGDQFHFLGCQVNAMPASGGVFTALAQRIAAAIPGLWGYVGVDLVQNGAHNVVIEINPRLTTSYAGLRRALDCNPAALVLSLLNASETPRLPQLSCSKIDVEVTHAG
ncbi:MAG: ATP-grasp domain-containing protein [Burkholderiales bacterium]